MEGDFGSVTAHNINSTGAAAISEKLQIETPGPAGGGDNVRNSHRVRSMLVTEREYFSYQSSTSNSTEWENVALSQFHKALDPYPRLRLRKDFVNRYEIDHCMPGPGFIRLCTEVFDELPCMSLKALRHRLITTEPEESSAMLSGLPLSEFHELVSNVFCVPQ